jgi:hypothetical protein
MEVYVRVNNILSNELSNVWEMKLESNWQLRIYPEAGEHVNLPIRLSSSGMTTVTPKAVMMTM